MYILKPTVSSDRRLSGRRHEQDVSYDEGFVRPGRRDGLDLNDTILLEFFFFRLWLLFGCDVWFRCNLLLVVEADIPLLIDRRVGSRDAGDVLLKCCHGIGEAKINKNKLDVLGRSGWLCFGNLEAGFIDLLTYPVVLDQLFVSEILMPFIPTCHGRCNHKTPAKTLQGHLKTSTTHSSQQEPLP